MWIHSKVQYVSCDDKVCIICPEHGEFWQTPHSHIGGSGCPKCNFSHLERDILNSFDDFEPQKKFDWLKLRGRMPLDFYNDELKIAIECQGIQHFTSRGNYLLFGDLNSIEERDSLKFELCKEHEVEIIYYFPIDFLKFGVQFYDDKKCFHTVQELKKYISGLKK